MNFCIYPEQEPAVVVASDRYEELIIAEQKYKLIVEAALTGASISSWSKEVDLNTGAVEAAIKSFEPARVLFVKNELMKQDETTAETSCELIDRDEYMQKYKKTEAAE